MTRRTASVLVLAALFLSALADVPTAIAIPTHDQRLAKRQEPCPPGATQPPPTPPPPSVRKRCRNNRQVVVTSPPPPAPPAPPTPPPPAPPTPAPPAPRSFRGGSSAQNGGYPGPAPRPTPKFRTQSTQDHVQAFPPPPPSTPAPAGPAPPGFPAFTAAAWLEAHNSRRRLHVDTPDLTWSDEVAATAQTQAARCTGDHSTPDDRKGYGENIMNGGGEGVASPEGTMRWWYDKEIASKGGHATQVVWRSTTQVGCGVAACAPDSTSIVCNYSPPGNYPDMSKDVLPLKSGR